MQKTGAFSTKKCTTRQFDKKQMGYFLVANRSFQLTSWELNLFKNSRIRVTSS